MFYRNILIVLLLIIPVISNAQIKCFRSPTTWNISIGIENYLQERHTMYKQFPGFSSVDIIGSLSYKKFTYSIGVGYAYDEEIVGFDMLPITTFKLVNTLTFDSTYWIGDQMFHYYEELKIYDSIRGIKAVIRNSEYQYFKLPIGVKYHLYSYWDIHIFASFKGNLFYEIHREYKFIGGREDEITDNYTQMLEPRKSKFYAILGLGPEVTWHIVNYNRNSTIKNSSMIKKISIFFAILGYYQPVKFQPDYKPIYLSFNLGVRLLSF